MNNKEPLSHHQTESTLDSAQNFERSDRLIRVGIIVDVINYYHNYLVSFSGDPAEQCVLGSAITGGASVTPHSIPQIGSFVIVVTHQAFSVPTIISVVPQEITALSAQKSDWILQHSGSTAKDDQPHKLAIEKRANSRVFSAQRPYDTYQGEWGYTNPLGMAIHMSLGLLMARASDICGLWMFQADNHMRMAAYSYSFWSALHESVELEDEGENILIRKSSPYPWEMRGLKAPGTWVDESQKGSGFAEDGTDPLWDTNATANRLEPIEVDQVGIPRITEIGGYPGDLERTVVSCPPQDFEGPETLSNPTNHTGLADRHQYVNGLYSIRTAKGLRLEKYGHIPVPKQLKTPEDPSGDTQEEGFVGEVPYKFAGQYGDGDDHDLTEFDGPNAIAQLYDRMAWEHNKLGMQVLRRHTGDWHIPNESDLDTFSGGEAIDPDLFTPSDRAVRDLPKFVSLQVDHRPNSSHKYFLSRSVIELLDDGSILLEDGYGSQIIMSGGNITLSCSGDVNLQPGRSLNVLAPKDANIRAGESLDLTSSNGDVRVKAERNLHMLGGNSGEGGILLESRSTELTQDFANKQGTDVQSSGIIMKAENSGILSYAGTHYIRSLNAGSIYLDADDRTGQVYIGGKGLSADIQDEIHFRFNTETGGTSFSRNQIIFGDNSTSVSVGGSLIVGGNGSFGSSVTALSTVKAQSVSANSVVGKSVSDGVDTAGVQASDRQNINTSISRLLTAVNADTKEVRLLLKETNGPQGETKYGDTNVLKSFGFSLRNDDQYGVVFEEGDFFEFRWQQMFNSFGNSTETWSEPIVNSPDNVPTLPYPGHNTWTGATIYSSFETKYWDNSEGEQPDLTQYDAAEGGAIELKVLESNYIINKTST